VNNGGSITQNHSGRTTKNPTVKSKEMPNITQYFLRFFSDVVMYRFVLIFFPE